MKSLKSIVFTLLIGMNAFAQQTNQFVQELNAHLNKLAKEDYLSGVVLVEKDNKIIFHQAYGYANLTDSIRNNTQTKFNIASMGKMFTGMAIMQLLETGKLSIEDKVGKHLPGFPNKSISDSVTISHLLTHTSGMGNDWFLAENTGENRKSLERTYTDQRLGFIPGSQFSYSNDGYKLLGLIIESISGSDYYSHVRQKIFIPLNMRATDNFEMDHIIRNMAMGYLMSAEEPGQWLNNVYLSGKRGSPAGGAYSTTEDLLKFAKSVRNNTLINQKTTSLYTKGRYSYHKGMYGYGFSEEVINGHRIIGHAGGHFGVASELLMFEDLGYTVIILTNGEVENYWSILNFVKLQLTGETPYLKSYYHTQRVVSATLNRGYDDGLKIAHSNPDLAVRESLVERMGYGQLFRSNYKKAIDIFKLNVACSPTSENTHYHLGEAYRLSGEKKQAIIEYNKYLEMDPSDENVKEKVKSLSTQTMK